MDLTTYDAYGRPKSSVQTILGSIIAETQLTGAASVGAGDKLSLTIEGDGVTPAVLEWHATARSDAAGSNVYILIKDAAGGVGTTWGSSYVHSYTGSANLNLGGQTKVVPPWTGSKTFYLHLNNTAGSPTIFGTNDNVITFLRARRAHVHTLGQQPPYLVDQVPWTTVTLQNGWVHHNDTNFSPIQYMKDATGTVFVRGLGTAPSSPNAVAFTLPVGCRPLKNIIFAQNCNSNHIDMRYASSGTAHPASGAVAGGWVSFTASFKAEQ